MTSLRSLGIMKRQKKKEKKQKRLIDWLIDWDKILYKTIKEFNEKCDGYKCCDYEGNRNYYSRNDLVNKEDRRVWDDK